MLSHYFSCKAHFSNTPKTQGCSDERDQKAISIKWIQQTDIQRSLSHFSVATVIIKSSTYNFHICTFSMCIWFITSVVRPSVDNAYFCVWKKKVVLMFLHWNYTELWSLSCIFKTKELHKNEPTTKMVIQIAATPSCSCQWLLIGLEFWSRCKWLSEWVGRAILRAQRSINTNLWGIWAQGNMHKLFLSGCCLDVNEKTRRRGQTG